MPTTRLKLPSQERLKHLLRYYPDTGLLFWRVRPRSDFETFGLYKQWNNRFACREAFTARQKHGHLIGQVDGVRYQAHRIIWKYVHGSDPEFIDHVDRDPSNNRILNLRDVSHAENMRNHPAAGRGVSGIIGVERSKSGRSWKYRLKRNGSIYEREGFDTVEAAALARKEFERTLSL